MSRKPSTETELKTLRRDYKRMSDAQKETLRELTAYRGRATKAETEAAEWRRRFDILLSREPTLTASDTTSGNQHG